MNLYFVKKWFLRKLFKLMKKTPLDMPMVKYWQKSEAVLAAVCTNEEGAVIMKMGEGENREKYDFPGYPRGYLLFGEFMGRPYGPLSVLKHEIKNQLFNESWYSLEAGRDRKEVIKEFKNKLFNIFKITEKLKYDLIPPQKMFKGVKELWRAMTVLEKKYPENKYIEPLKKTLTFIMSEDDSYRFRIMWIIQIFNPSVWWSKLFFRNPIKDFDIALKELENAEVVEDMRERIRLLRRILLLILEDKNIKQLFLELCKEMNWNKLKITEMEKFHFRAKYFKCDFDKFDY